MDYGRRHALLTIITSIGDQNGFAAKPRAEKGDNAEN